MKPEDREHFNELLERQARLENDVRLIRTDLFQLGLRLEADKPAEERPLPPLPVSDRTAYRVERPIPSFLNKPEPLPAPVHSTSDWEHVRPAATSAEPMHVETPTFPPIPPLSATAQTPTQDMDTMEIKVGRWLARIGVVFALITLISFSTLAYGEFYKYMGPWSKEIILTLVSAGLIATGFFLEKRQSDMLIYARTLNAGGLGCLYYTLYGATYVDQLRINFSPLLGTLLLLGWSAAVLFMAERRKSELLSIFAVALAYFSTGISQVGEFTMVTNLILAATAVIFLIRNAWTGLSYLCLVGTYVGFLKQILVLQGGFFYFVPHISFWPSAVYLIGAWAIYTAGIFFANTPTFVSGKRIAFLCLNNGLFITLLIIADRVTGFDQTGVLCVEIGGLWLATCYLLKAVRKDAEEAAQAYLMQGLAICSAGLVIANSGVTRGMVITAESVFLAASAAYSRNWIFKAFGLATGALGTLFLMLEVHSFSQPWVLIGTGAVSMLVNALLNRRDYWMEESEPDQRRLNGGALWFSSLAVLLIAFGTGAVLPPDEAECVMAGAALILTFATYIVPIYELPIVAQGLFCYSQARAVSPLSDPHAWWEEMCLALGTFALAFWWPKQRVIWSGSWTRLIEFINVFALVPILICLVHPLVSPEGWLGVTSVLALAFLGYGFVARTWTFPLVGQVFLLISIGLFLDVPNFTFNWSWWAALAPVLATGITAFLVRPFLESLVANLHDSGLLDLVKVASFLYRAITVFLLIAYVFGYCPTQFWVLAFYAIATSLYAWLIVKKESNPLAWAMVFNLAGAAAFFVESSDFEALALIPNGLGCLLFLAQPAILRFCVRGPLTELVGWSTVLMSSAMAWAYVSGEILEWGAKLSLGWALLAIALLVLGFLSGERRQRWCGLALLIMTFVRVATNDFWTYSDLFKLLTFFVLSVACLGLSFIYYRFADRIKTWL